MNRKTSSAFLVLSLFGLLLLAGCANVKLEPAPQNISPIAPIAKDLPIYRIQVGDVLEIRLALNPEFNQEVVVRPDGKFSTMLVQDVSAYGLTPQDVKEELVSRYRKQLRDPQITVGVRSFAPTRVYVLGEVTSPGEFITVGPNLTMLQAIARAGGVKNSADTSKIVVLRRGADDQPMAFAADYDKATTGEVPGADVRLAAYDVVFVPRSGIAEVGKAYEQYIRQFVPLTFGFTYQVNNKSN